MKAALAVVLVALLAGAFAFVRACVCVLSTPEAAHTMAGGPNGVTRAPRPQLATLRGALSLYSANAPCAAAALVLEWRT